MTNALEATKEMIKTQVDVGKICFLGIPFSEYQKVYRSTNENIHGYMSKIDFAGKEKALSVLASGDHVLNLIYHDILKVDTFDTNKLTAYYTFGIKIPAILAFGYQEFLEWMRRIIDKDLSLEELNELMRPLFPFMEKNCYYYWKRLLDYNYQIQKDKKKILNLFRMILININAETLSIAQNTYLQSKENYNKVKENLQKAHITFKCCDCLFLGEEMKGQYDLVFLSNIADYFSKAFDYFWTYEKLRGFEESLKPIMKQNGLIALAYLIKYHILSNNQYRTYPILSSKVTKEDLKDEYIITFPHIEQNYREEKVEDGLILQRIC